MAEKEPVSESSGVRVVDGSGVVEEVSAKPAVAGVLSVVYVDGLENPPLLALSGEPGVPETLLVVDGSGTPVAKYTAGPVAQTRGENHAHGHFLPAGMTAVVPAVPVVPVVLSDRRVKADIVAVDWSR